MSHFVYDDLNLAFPKSDLEDTPLGQEAHYIDDGDWNGLCQAVDDLRDFATHGQYLGLASMTEDPAPAGLDSYFWVKSDSTLHFHRPDGVDVSVLSQEAVSVMDYGAVGDGVTDDSVAIQAAAEAAEAAGLPLFFPEPPVEYVVGGATSDDVWGDAYGGIKLWEGAVVFAESESVRVKKGPHPCNYVFRGIGVSAEMFGMTIDVAADLNYRVGVFLVGGKLKMHDMSVVSSLKPTPGWTIHGVLPSGANDLTIRNVRFVRCQCLGGAGGNNVVIRDTEHVNPYNQGISVVTGDEEKTCSLSVVGARVFGAMDSGIYWGADGGTTFGTYDDVEVLDCTVDGWSLNYGIFGRYGTSNSRWDVKRNHVRGGASASTTIASATAAGATTATGTTASAWANTHAYVLGNKVSSNGHVYNCVTAGTSAGSGGPGFSSSQPYGSSIVDGGAHWAYVCDDATALPADGKLYVELGTRREEVARYTRSGAVFTFDRALTFAHATGDLWGLTGVAANNTIAILISPAEDDAAGPMTGLHVDDNYVSNVDLYGVAVTASTDMSDWSIDGNHANACRGVVLFGSAALLWRDGSMSDNECTDCVNYGLFVATDGGAQGRVTMVGNTIDGVTGANAGIVLQATTAGTLRALLVGNSAQNCNAPVQEVTSGGGAVTARYVANDFAGNTGGATVAATAYALGNAGMADQVTSITFQNGGVLSDVGGGYLAVGGAGLTDSGSHWFLVRESALSGRTYLATASTDSLHLLTSDADSHVFLQCRHAVPADGKFAAGEVVLFLDEATHHLKARWKESDNSTFKTLDLGAGA